jgi:hypothetical protein
MVTSELCVHEMATGTCGWCNQHDPRSREVTARVLVSPQRMGHLDGGCGHKDDPDYRKWGTVSAAGAWQSLCNRNPVPADPPSTLIATGACQDCQNGPLG